MNKFILIFFCLSMITGCASIIKEPTQDIVINTYPDKADVEIKNSKGYTIRKITTPDIVTLKRSDGSYFGSENYSIEVKKEGYESQTIILRSRVNNWYIWGNLGFGYIIGWLIVDPNTGAMYNLEPNEINKHLKKAN